MRTFVLPDLGEGLPDGEIVKWHVQEGELIQADAPLVSIETAKAIVEVPSPYTGKILKLHGKSGDIIPTGSALVDYDVELRSDSATVAGEIKVGNEILVEKPTAIAKGSSLKALPAVRALAKKLNVDLSVVNASGSDGHITLEDVKKASDTLSLLGPLELIRGMRRSMAITMALSHAQVVPVTVVDDADITSWVKEKDFTVRVILAVVSACQEEPLINQWYDAQAIGRRILSHINIGLAMDTQEGLLVPVIKDAQIKSHQELKNEIAILKNEVKDRTIRPEKMEGASILLSNFGKFAGRYANPIVVPPTVVTIAIGAKRDTPSVQNGEIVIRSMLPLSLTFDHRALTGGDATRFLSALIKCLQK